MKILALTLLASVVLLATGCIWEAPTPENTPAVIEATPDIQKTVEAGVQGTRQVEAELEATVEARILATLNAPLPTATPAPTATPYPTGMPYPTATPLPTSRHRTTLTLVPTPTPVFPRSSLPTPTPIPSRPTPPPGERLSIKQYAARHAGGPGAIYVGDLRQLAGLAPNHQLGDVDGNVPLSAINRHDWIFESDYYQSLLEKARVTNPTQLTSSGERIEIQHVCINRALLPCVLIESYLAPNVEDRTNGELRLVVSSFPELGLAGPDTLRMISDETLDMANVYNGYIAGELPVAEVTTLWGIYPDHQTTFESLTKTLQRIDAILAEETDRGSLLTTTGSLGTTNSFSAGNH